MSISPLAAHTPKRRSTGSIHTAGHSQSPLGSCARTSTLPYCMPARRLAFGVSTASCRLTRPLVKFCAHVHPSSGSPVSAYSGRVQSASAAGSAYRAESTSARSSR